jgi:CheY-like chemotaxis protein
MDPAELLALVFRPGFSTARAVSTLSGRGVGLDVVRDAVRSLGGFVEVALPPTLGGASIRARVPVTFAMLRGLVVRSGGAVSALPIEHVVRALRVPASSLRTAGGGVVAEIEGGAPLRLVSPGGAISRSRGSSSGFASVVVLASSGRRLGLVVDEILGEEQLVTHALPWNLRRVPGVSALFVLADGRPSVVFDVGHFFDAEHAVGAIAGPTAALAEAGRPRRVLVVDDSLAVRTLVRNTLQSAGYEVVVKADGQEGWDALQEEEFSLVVSDVRMPRMDGLELTRLIRADPRLKALPVVLVTSLDRREDIAAGAAVGANEYIVKGTMDQSRILETVARFA